MAIINLVVSDGDPSRGQRESLLSNEIKKVGVANGEHEVYRHCSAIITSTEFDNTFDKDDNGLLTQSKPKNIKSIEIESIDFQEPVELTDPEMDIILFCAYLSQQALKTKFKEDVNLYRNNHPLLLVF